MTSNNQKNYSLRHNQTLPSGDCQPMTVNMDTSHSPRWSENSFSWGLMVLSEGKEVKRWGHLNNSRNWVLASGTPFPHIGVLRTLCSKLSSTGLQDQFGTQVGKISRAPTRILHQRSSYICTLPSTLPSYFLLLRPRTHLILQFLPMKTVTIMLVHTLIQPYHAPGTIQRALCVWNKFNLHNKPIY